MAEQNILNGGIDVLQQIIGDLQEHNDKVDRLDNLNAAVKGLTKEIESNQKGMKAETDQKVGSATQAVCEGYDKSIAAEKSKIKQLQSERDKAKTAGMNDRISKETDAYHKENEMLKGQIVEAFKLEKVPMIANSRLFFAFFAARNAMDYVLFTIIDVIVFLCIPALFLLIPDVPVWLFILYYFAAATGWNAIHHIVDAVLITPHSDTIEGARKNKKRIADNKARIRKITKGIRSDKNEDMYDLGNFDYEINAVHDNISAIESKKAAALEEFEKNTKPDIVAEIENRYMPSIASAQKEVEKKNQEILSLDELVKQQRIYISSNYEAYLGKEFLNLDKLQEMQSFMKSGIAETIGQAMAAYRDRH